jgi:hypothetical protein
MRHYEKNQFVSNFPNLVSGNKAAKLLNIGKADVVRLIEKGEILGVVFKRTIDSIVVDLRSIDKFLQVVGPCISIDEVCVLIGVKKHYLFKLTKSLLLNPVIDSVTDQSNKYLFSYTK